MTAAAVAGAATLLAAGPMAAAAGAAAGPHLGRAVRLQLPANAMLGSTPIIESATCASASSCTLAGTYTDNANVGQAMVVTRSSGHWARAIELQLPANADPGIGGLAESVSCSRPGSCVAVGNYRSNGEFEGFTAAESSGVWHQARQVRLPANAGTTGASISAVACTGPGSCVLAGNYSDNHGHVRPMVAIESKGAWAQARELRVPAGASATGRVLLTSLACPKLGSCAAVGQFDDTAGHARAMAVTESGGTWHQAFQLVLPSDAAGVPLVSVTGGRLLRRGRLRRRRLLPHQDRALRPAVRGRVGRHLGARPAHHEGAGQRCLAGQRRAHLCRLHLRGDLHRGR